MVAAAFCNASKGGISLASQFTDSESFPSSSARKQLLVPALRGKDYDKSKKSYPDYTETESGLQYKDLRVGDGPKPKVGETVVGQRALDFVLRNQGLIDKTLLFDIELIKIIPN